MELFKPFCHLIGSYILSTESRYLKAMQVENYYTTIQQLLLENSAQYDPILQKTQFVCCL